MDNYMISEVFFTGTLANSAKATISAEGYDADSKIWKGKSASIPFNLFAFVYICLQCIIDFEI